MKIQWKAVAALTVASTSLSFATYARVESMGKHDTYFMDDVSVWDNPANSNIYPNYLMGDLGQLHSTTVDTNNYKGLARYNRDPSNPWFGAVFAKSLGDSKSTNRYPQITIGGAFNRDDEILNNIGTSGKLAKDSLPLKMDGMLGFATSNGMMFGLKAFGAGNEIQSVGHDSAVWVTRYTLGLNIPVTQGVDFELAGGPNYISYTKDSASYGTHGLGFDAHTRAFISAPVISGEIVPAASIFITNPYNNSVTDVKAGLGANVSLDRGFFWIGADYVYHKEEWDGSNNYDSTSKGARVSFGIERNVWTDWLVLRVGGQKYMTFDRVHDTRPPTARTTTPSTLRESWNTNPINDGTTGDHVGFGIGINVEDKLKVDATMGEDLVFTGGGLLSGPSDHVFSRISATYSF